MRRNCWRFAQPLAVALTLLMSTGALFAASFVWEGEQALGLNGNKAFKVKKLVRDSMGKVSAEKVVGIDKVPQGAPVPQGSVNYRIKVPAAGKYYLWARVRWSTGCGNSFYMIIDGVKGQRLLGGDGTYDSLHWIRLMDNGRPLTLTLKKGTVVFTLKSKESGAMVDQFYLTTDKESIPAGIYKPTANLLEIPKK